MSKTPNRRAFLKTATGLAGLLSTAAAAAATARAPHAPRAPRPATDPNPAPAPPAPAAGKRPNVLLILADDLGWSDLGCYGGEIHTPNLDSLAKDGLRFTQFYNSARCCPSRAAILTGLNPHQAGIPDMSGPLNDRCVTLAEVLKDAGYGTYMVGKWHVGEQKPPTTRGFDEFYGMLGGFNSYWQEHPYQTRLPEGRPARAYAPGQFYTTNAFGDYALDFLEDGRRSGRPWFLYLAFNAAHFPLHAPEADIEKYEALYREKGWDGVRADRLARQKKLGLVPPDLALTPRGTVPPNFINVKTGWADKEIPAWDSLPDDRRADLARRMAVYAAAIDVMDRNIGRVIARLKETGELDDTVIFFLSDNGACAEWDPYGFDKLDSTLNVVHKGADLKRIGAPESYCSYGAGWANACDTPWRLYKHYAQEGGIRTPLIVHWPAGLKTAPGALASQPGYIADFMPTLVELCGAAYPARRGGADILPMEGRSLAPIFRKEDPGVRTLCVEHEGSRMVREGDWKLVALPGRPWELYNLLDDPAEMHDLSGREPGTVKRMSDDWDRWAARCGVVPAVPTPRIARRAIAVTCDVTPPGDGASGVLVAQGGSQRGWALWMRDGRVHFGVREGGTLTDVAAPDPVAGRFSVVASLAPDGAMTLTVNGKAVAAGKAPSLIQQQPLDGLSVGEDTQSPVGSYTSPFRFRGMVEHVRVDTGGPNSSADDE